MLTTTVFVAMHPSHQVAVIGGGPAGLHAAECAARMGAQVTLFDAKPSVGRKFLVAGKGGLNLTHGESLERFATRYEGPNQATSIWQNMLADFGPDALRSWAAKLGVETFQATSGRVYPVALKAAPLLRRWTARLKELGVCFEMNHRCLKLIPGTPHRLEFENGNFIAAKAVVFALGGGSWPQTGSDGKWLSFFKSLGVCCHPLVAANCGWEVPWPEEVIASAEGLPIKNIDVSAGEITVTGELLVTRYGIEGGAIYQLGAALRAMPAPMIVIDFKPTFTHAQLVKKMQSVRRNFLTEARVRWRLSDAAFAILNRQSWQDAETLAEEAKHCVIQLTAARPLAEAISSAGGIGWEELDERLMIKRHPGIFVAGEMIDWEAPTGGYLMQGCFTTGQRAGESAARWSMSIMTAPEPIPLG